MKESFIVQKGSFMTSHATIYREEMENGIALYHLENREIRLTLTNVGCAIVKLEVRDRYGEFRDVVLGFDKLEKYRSNTTYFGAIVGRIAGKVVPASFRWRGKTVQLSHDAENVHLHGGEGAISFRDWDAKIQGDALQFHIHSSDGDNGYPGDMDIQVIYRLEDHGVCLTYQAWADKCTPVNLIAHPYFNLNGHDSGSVLGHKLCLKAATFNDTEAPWPRSARIYACEEYPAYDFRELKRFAQEQYDCNYILSKDGSADATLYAEESGILLQVSCTQPCMQLYTACETHETGKGGVQYHPYDAVCLEAQHFPNAVNIPDVETPHTDPGGCYRQEVHYIFSAAQSLAHTDDRR